MRALPVAIMLALQFWHGSVAAQQYDLRVFGVEDGLPGSSVEAITQDRDGYLWIVTGNGVARFDGRRFTRYTDLSAVDPQGRHVLDSALKVEDRTDGSCALRLSNGDRLCAQRNGLLIEHAGTDRSTAMLGGRNGLAGLPVRCLFQDRSGVVWVGTEHGGITRMVSDAVSWLDAYDGLPGSVIGAIHRTPDGSLRISTTKGTVERNPGSIAWHLVDTLLHQGGTDVLLPNGHRWTAGRGIYDHAPDGVRTLVGRDTVETTCMVIAGDSMLIGTHHGLYQAPLDNSAAQWRPLIHAGPEDVSSLAYDVAGNVWMGTATDGLVRYRSNAVQRWRTAEGLASDNIRFVLLDAYQNLWVGTDRGFNLIELDEAQEEVINIRGYGLADGFPGIEAMPNACLLDTDSALWFGTTRGAIRFDPRRVLEDPIAPRTRITDLALFFEHPDLRPWCDSLDAAGLPVGLRLPHDRDHLTFTLTGLSLAYPERVRFQYMLEGRDADWSPITGEDHVTFSGLEPGQYAFLVKARNGSGVWNDEPARFAFSIEPPYWATNWFRAGAGALLLVGFIGVQRVRDRRTRKTRERLERMVEARTHELAEEKHRSDRLLLNILPEATAAELKVNGVAQAHSYAACTVLFSDFQGFTGLSEQLEATGIVTELDRFFRAFDRITDTYGVEKIKTIGDAYMCASGVPNPTPTHALDAVLMALEMLDVVDTINRQRVSEGHPAWPIRIGLHSGPLIAGVVGEKKFAYDVWGDTVNLASRMESNGAPGRVNVTGAVVALVEPYVICEPRGLITVKGKGDIASWFIDRLRPEYSDDERGHRPNERLMEIRRTQHQR